MDYEISLLTTMGVSIIFALSLNMVTGFCGQISLGHAAFLGIGAYAAALAGKAGVPFLATIPIAMTLSGMVGLLVGLASLRVRSDFLAITTMGVGFLFVGFIRQQETLGGELGVSGIAESGLSKPEFMLFVLTLSIMVGALSLYLKRAWIGRVFNGISEDEDTMRMLGINVPRYKLAAFAVGTSLAGMAGSLYAYNLRFIGPDSFGFVESVTVLSMVVVGGIGSVGGVAIAAAILSVLPAWFQVIGDYKLLAYGSLLFLMMRFSPGGISALVVRILRARSSKCARG